MAKFRDTERGQALIIGVFVIVILLVFAGLAIDGGTVFLERRFMQNAADAGALAGTRELAEKMCDEDFTPEAADAAIWAAVKDYAEQNGVQDPADNTEAYYVKFEGTSVVQFDPPVQVGAGTLPDGAVGVIAKTNIERRTTLMQLLGVETSNASAFATGVCGPPLTGGGLRPVGVPDELVKALETGDWFTIDFDRNDIIWATGASQIRGWLNFMHIWNTLPELNEEAQGWPRVVGMPQGADEKKYLDDWMADGWNGAVYGGDWIHALPGATTSKVCTAPENTLIYLPIYDEEGAYECEDVPDPKPECPTAGGKIFHIVGFVGAEITECKKAPDKTITMELVEVIKGEGVPAPNAGYGEDICETTGVWIVSLWQ
jgi:Flp pilus assembly protein TadG